MAARADARRGTARVSVPATARSPGALGTAAAWAFALLFVTLPGPIAPMGIATGLCVVTTLALVATRHERWPRTPVDRAMLGWALALLLSALFAQDRAASLPRLTKALFPLLAGVATLRARNVRDAERALAAWFAATAAVAVWGTGVWVMHGASFAQRARGLSGHYMTFAGQLSLMLPVAIAIAVRDRRPAWRIGSGLAALLALVALGATFTRSAWIAFVVSCAVIAGFTWPLALIVLAVVVGGVFAFAPGSVGARLRSVFDPHNPWNQQRVYMWDAGLRMFRDHPWTGVGLQDLHRLYDQYRLPQATERAGHLHNVIVQVAAQMGAIGLAAFAWLYGSLAGCAAIGLPASLRRGGFAGAVRLGALAAIVGFLVAGFFEWNFGDEELLYGLWALAGLAWAASTWDAETPDAPRGE